MNFLGQAGKQGYLRTPKLDLL